MADRSLYTNLSECTDLIYHDNLFILWQLAWDIQAQCGQWSRCLYHILCILGQHHKCLLENFSLVDSGPGLLWWSSQAQISDLTKLAADGSQKNLDKVTNMYLSWIGLSFYHSFGSLIFLNFSLCFSLSSFFLVISFKYFFALLVTEYMRLFCPCIFTSLSIQSLCCLSKCPFQ